MGRGLETLINCLGIRLSICLVLLIFGALLLYVFLYATDGKAGLVSGDGFDLNLSYHRTWNRNWRHRGCSVRTLGVAWRSLLALPEWSCRARSCRCDRRGQVCTRGDAGSVSKQIPAQRIRQGPGFAA